MKFRIQQNTDTRDIDSKCLGLSAWVPGDSLNILNSNRGLHIQIRHNGDQNTYEAANKLSKLVRYAPEMLEVLKNTVTNCSCYGRPNDACTACLQIYNLITKVEGDSPCLQNDTVIKKVQE